VILGRQLGLGRFFSSVFLWSIFLSSVSGRGGAELRRMIEESEPFALTGIVVAEVLQGLKRDAGVIERCSWHSGTC